MSSASAEAAEDSVVDSRMTIVARTVVGVVDLPPGESITCDSVVSSR